jgi:hypothetical protein
MDIDFNNLKTGEDLSVDNSSDVFNCEHQRLAKELRILCKQHGKKVILPAQVSREAKVSVPQIAYDTRLHTLLHIIRNPELTDRRYPLADTWKDNFPSVPYNSYATSWNISDLHKKKLIDELVKQDMYKRFRFSSIQDLIKFVYDYYKDTRYTRLEEQLEKANAKLAKYEFIINHESQNMVYKGVEFKYTTRGWKANVGGIEVKIPTNAIQRLLSVFQMIDSL